jgi:hypothetical protein
MKAIILFTIIFSNSLLALEFSSGPKKVQIIELFSSEGCSSCPSAEKWLNKLKGSDLLWKHFIPVEQHVTYWDDLVWFGSSWKDPFATKKATERQRFYNSIRGKGVYTPQLIVDGEVSKKYDMRSLKKDINVGSLKVNFEKETQTAKLKFIPIGNYKNLYCEGTYLLGGAISKVKGGENKNDSLPHEFISPAIKKRKAIKENGVFTCQITLDNEFVKLPFKNRSIAFWIKNSNHKIIQAVGGEIN